MSRFEEVVNDAIGEVILGEATFKAETLAQHIAELVRERQDARRAEVTIAARYPEHKPAPVSGITTQEIYTLLGSAVASERGTRRLVGVAAQGMTACPCAQGLVAGRVARAAGRRRLHRRRDRARLRARPGRHPQPARARHAARSAAPRPARTRSTRCVLLRDRRGLDVVGDLRADEALRRGRRGREGPPPPALRRGLRARDDRRRGRALPGPRRRRLRLRPPGEPRDDPPAQRRGRALRDCSASCATSSPTGEPAERHTALRAWLDDARLDGSSRARALRASASCGAARRSSRRPTARSPRR